MSQTAMLRTNDVSSAFASAMAQALHQLDPNGRVTAENALLLRRAIATTPIEHRVGVAMEPERYLGAFEALPKVAREAIVQAITDNDRWRFAVSRWRRALRAKLGQGRFESPANRLMNQLEAAYRRRLLWQVKFAARPTFASMLALAQLDPRYFAICYAQGVPQLAAFRGFWHDPVRQNTVGVMLGLDLLPSADGWWFLESNLDSALREERSALYQDDPFVTSLFEFIRAKGYQHLIVMTNSTAPVNKQMAKQYEEGAAAQKIRLTILEDTSLQQSTYRQSYGVPPLHGERTLVVRKKFYPTSCDHLFHHKLASWRALRLFNQCSAEPRLPLPPAGLQPTLDYVDPDDPFPNLVYKLPGGARGLQVMLLKAMSLEHARGLVREIHSATQRPRHHARPLARLAKRMLQLPESGSSIWIFQPYVRSAMLPGRHLYIVRAHVLLTPIGAHFLSAHRVVSSSPVPEHLPPGLVQDPTPYIVNYSRGARYEVVPPEEELVVSAAALAVARGLSWAFAYSFQTGA